MKEAFMHKIVLLTSLPVCSAATNDGAVGVALLHLTAKTQSLKLCIALMIVCKESYTGSTTGSQTGTRLNS